MKTLYLECAMGAAGDMLMAALLELIPDPDRFIEHMNSLRIPGVVIHKQLSQKCGINGTHISVHVGGAEEESVDVHDDGQAHHEHEHEHHHEHEHKHKHEHHHDHMHEHAHDHSHTGMTEVCTLINALDVASSVKEHALAVYGLIAEAEAHAHGRPVDQVHFHEVGSMDAVADILGVCLLMEELAPERIVVSPVHVGAGMVRCSHGILPVPAPATAFILKDVPIYGGMIRGELCTPTGAAILKHFATEFGGMPVMRVSSIGYGMGKKDFEAANCVRAMLGETGHTSGPNGDIVELTCNLDDMTGEALGFALDALLLEGALDAFVVPIQMKKSRPGQMLVCLCNQGDADRLAECMLKHTTSFGVRRAALTRYMLDRKFETAETALGPIRKKTGMGYGVEKFKFEYEDVAAAAKSSNLSINEALMILNKNEQR